MEVIVILLLVLLNGFFALSEIALVSSRTSRLEESEKLGRKGAGTALDLLKDPDKFLSSIQVGITLIGILTGMYGGMNIADDLTPLFAGIVWVKPYAYEIALTLTVILITYVSILFGELVPKTMALSNPEKVAIKISPWIHVFSLLFYPFVRLLSGSTGLVNKLLGIGRQEAGITGPELRTMLRDASKVGVIEKEQKTFHENLFYFSDKRARHIMTHRT
ncbi:MAG TPA: CNNM domain-containing protein [Lentimicrobium sp.]|jgi:putative hemolysin|nr:CNNM domain-containing protein [Lentimicrobium sp.]